ncbi:Peptide deformylase [Streptomyces hirsutus]
MAQQDTDQQQAGVLPVDEEGYVIDTEGGAEREAAWVERGTSRPITVVGNPVLHKECRDVTDFGPDFQQLVADMFASQRTAEGVGLAANQIGVDLKVFVYDCPDDDGARHVGVVCNPELVELPAEKRRLDDSNEGCLSVPTAYAPLARPDYAEVTGQDEAGQPGQGARHRLLRTVFAARDGSSLRLPVHRPALQAGTQGRAAADGRERAALSRGRQRLTPCHLHDRQGASSPWFAELPRARRLVRCSFRTRRRSSLRQTFDPSTDGRPETGHARGGSRHRRVVKEANAFPGRSVVVLNGGVGIRMGVRPARGKGRTPTGG